MLLKLTDDKYVEVDENDQARVVVKSELEKQVKQAEDRLKEIPQPPSDEELLAWAKANYPQSMDYSKEKEALQSLIASNQAVLSHIYGR